MKNLIIIEVILIKKFGIKRILVSLIMLALFGHNLYSQQDETIFRHYHLNHNLINPAVSGVDGVHMLRVNFRSQFAGFPGAPKTYSVGYNGPIGKIFGLGLNVLTENIASLNRYRLQMSYAFKYDINDLKLSAGFSTEFHEMRLEQGITNSALFDLGDALLQNAVDGFMMIDATLGIYAKYKENTFVSLSIPNLIRARLDDVVPRADDRASFLQYFMLMGGHKFYSDNASMIIEPSIMITKVLDVPVIFDANLKASFLNEKLVTGVSLRTGPSTTFGFLAGTKINNIRLNYSYDSHVGDFNAYHQGSHEVSMVFQLGPRAEEEIIEPLLPEDEKEQDSEENQNN